MVSPFRRLMQRLPLAAVPRPGRPRRLRPGRLLLGFGGPLSLVESPPAPRKITGRALGSSQAIAAPSRGHQAARPCDAADVRLLAIIRPILPARHASDHTSAAHARCHTQCDCRGNWDEVVGLEEHGVIVTVRERR